MKFEYNTKTFLVDGKPIIILAGEIHYYRLDPNDWQHALDELKNAGFNAVATYIPWCIHEQIEGDFDLTGKYKPQYDIIIFMELIKENDLFFIPRPGPFTMGEMVKDGIPTWVSEKHPECLIKSWNEAAATTVDHDYLEPGFLRAARNWYAQIIPLIAKYQDDNLVGIQLDNEIGMLAWVSNSPVLNKSTVDGLIEYVEQLEIAPKLSFDLGDKVEVQKNLYRPTETDSIILHDLLMSYFRERFVKYVELLEKWCYEFGVKECLFMINVHGTGAGKLYGYPIGLSQLYQTFSGKKNYICGSDIYFNDLNVQTVHDTYLTSALTEAVNDEHQPLTCLEFNASDGDFGFCYSGRVKACTLNHRARMMLGHSTKLFNFYLFTGGFNDFMNAPLGNGTDRIGTTGEKHGYGSPIRQDMTRNYTYDQTKAFGELVTNLNDKLASMLHVKDQIGIAFIPDYFKTEYAYPQSESYRSLLENIQRNTMDGANEVLMRYLIIRNYAPLGVNVQDNIIDVNKVQTLVVNSALYMDEASQTNLANYVQAGGKLILFGELPQFDLVAKPCTILADALGCIKVKDIDYRWPNTKRVAVTPTGFADGLPASFFDMATAINCHLNHQVFLKVYETNEAIGILVDDKVKAAIITTQYRCDTALFDRLFTALDVEQTVKVTSEFVGVNVTKLANTAGEGFLNVINMDDFRRQVKLEYPLTATTQEVLDLTVEPLDAMLLPINVKFKDAIINYATNELLSYEETSDLTLKFRLSGLAFELLVTTQKMVEAPANYTITRLNDTQVKIKICERKYGEDTVEIIIK
ncbi:MAG: beta-galactosidase [Mycoplasmatales bacterium]